ncbi:DUF4177 domain-containing protein [Thalassotalea sp. 1_MG-2023]|uniref:DUF4177 domain-containing protein n=1 Tax=Thalassotalea sp. 1_MG-2023 TaxID=3062680 RepID=UPI0026E3026D|nr:DUF4177 domain-containing protein [Thalassotalea sp. 1_MG-2023]MDO6427429.1 DUF4177 domain-containing protein [Thalassotalea sp. 1_MG-2023]
MTVKWQYKTLRFDKKQFISGRLDLSLLDEKLNAYGDMGWELVSLDTNSSVFGTDIAAVAVFKRIKE